jgi:hypothetical protein
MEAEAVRQGFFGLILGLTYPVLRAGTPPSASRARVARRSATRREPDARALGRTWLSVIARSPGELDSYPGPAEHRCGRYRIPPAMAHGP